ncbi:MAG: hypothetical protein ACREUQ_13830 [Burkholderiales bacterium]
MKTLMNPLLGALLVAATVAIAAHAKTYDSEQAAALIEALPRSKLSLEDGIRQVSKDGEVAISAKFEFDDNNKLSLSVYTAEKGLATDPEHNVLKEFSGSPEQKPWAPQAEVFKDIPHVARASEHLALMSVSRHSLAAIIGMAKKKHAGTAFAVTPMVKRTRPIAAVLLTDKGKVTEVDCDLISGQCTTSNK